MTSDGTGAGRRAGRLPQLAGLLRQYECGPVQFVGTGDAFYERHLTFDNVIDAARLGAPERCLKL
jgi:starch phosphorylase